MVASSTASHHIPPILMTSRVSAPPLPPRAQLVVVDTCPSEQAFHAFHDGAAFRALRTRHGLPAPDRIEDFPVTVAFAGGVAMPAAGARL